VSAFTTKRLSGYGTFPQIFSFCSPVSQMTEMRFFERLTSLTLRQKI
jgi:hypothetical protein